MSDTATDDQLDVFDEGVTVDETNVVSRGLLSVLVLIGIVTVGGAAVIAIFVTFVWPGLAHVLAILWDGFAF